MTSSSTWWTSKQKQLEAIVNSGQRTPCYVYDLDDISKRIDYMLSSMGSVDCIWYAVKANHNEQVIKTIADKGLRFECVSIYEIKHVLKIIGQEKAKTHILFTPNFVSQKELTEAFEIGCYVTLDNAWPLFKWPELFRNKNLIIRLDPSSLEEWQQHSYIKTCGADTKFGIGLDEINDVCQQLSDLSAKVIGLHVHVGSQIFDATIWKQNAENLMKITSTSFPDIKVINVGGGFGVNYHPSSDNQHGNDVLDLVKVNNYLKHIVKPGIELWIESGRYIVAEAGVLLASVTQMKHKGQRLFLGVDAGMNSLIRPALYGSYHHVVNLTALQRQSTQSELILTDVVGQICESSDFIAKNRLLPDNNQEGDIILISTAGAYGFVMANTYNMRPLPQEISI